MNITVRICYHPFSSFDMGLVVELRTIFLRSQPCVTATPTLLGFRTNHRISLHRHLTSSFFQRPPCLEHFLRTKDRRLNNPTIDAEEVS